VVFLPKSWIPRRKLSSRVSLNLLVYSSWWCEVNHNLWQGFWYTWMNKEVPPYLQLCRRATMTLKSKVLCCIIQVCFYESPIFKECLLMVSKAMQLLSTLSLRISVKRGAIAYQDWNFFNFLRYPWCVSCLSSRDVYEQSFHELTMRYSIFLKIHLPRVIPSFL
jgi:hypothetical protein